MNVNKSDDDDAREWRLSSSTYGWAAPRKGLRGCTAGNGGANVLPSLLGETMPRGFKDVEDGCAEEAPASSTGASHDMAYCHETVSWQVDVLKGIVRRERKVSTGASDRQSTRNVRNLGAPSA
jgi:hypothetical protein